MNEGLIDYYLTPKFDALSRQIFENACRVFEDSPGDWAELCTYAGLDPCDPSPEPVRQVCDFTYGREGLAQLVTRSLCSIDEREESIHFITQRIRRLREHKRSKAPVDPFWYHVVLSLAQEDLAEHLLLQGDIRLSKQPFRDAFNMTCESAWPSNLCAEQYDSLERVHHYLFARMRLLRSLCDPIEEANDSAACNTASGALYADALLRASSFFHNLSYTRGGTLAISFDGEDVHCDGRMYQTARHDLLVVGQLRGGLVGEAPLEIGLTNALNPFTMPGAQPMSRLVLYDGATSRCKISPPVTRVAEKR